VSATGKPFVKYWLHNNLVTVNGQKMSKSLGNYTTLKDAFKNYDPLVIRFFILQSHYRSTLDFSDGALQGARAGLDKLLNTVQNVNLEIAKSGKANESSAGSAFQHYKIRFLEAMDDDWNTPQAIAVLFDLAKEVNQILSTERKGSPEELKAAKQLFRELGGSILGIVPAEEVSRASMDGNIQADLIELLVSLRNEARHQKLWTMSDMIRDGLKKLGIALEDKKDGTTWKKVP
jgi:cysteinyl-tRNA synthetase